MIIFVSGATSTVKKFKGNPYIGQLMSPRAANKYMDGFPVAADNSAYSDWNESRFMRMLDKIEGKNIKWVAAPDVVGDAVKTMDLFYRWHNEIKVKRRLPIAYVLQDGQEKIGLPHTGLYDAVFVGGSTDFKLGSTARMYINAARSAGKWVHMGRVNTFRRLKYAIDIGCDSVDGTTFSIEPKNIKRFVNFLSRHERQTIMFE